MILNALDHTPGIKPGGKHKGCWLRYLGRQGDVKGCIPPTVTGGPYPTAVRFHNGMADGQPHAAALRLLGKERKNSGSSGPFGNPTPVSLTVNWS